MLRRGSWAHARVRGQALGMRRTRTSSTCGRIRTPLAFTTRFSEPVIHQISPGLMHSPAGMSHTGLATDSGEQVVGTATVRALLCLAAKCDVESALSVPAPLYGESRRSNPWSNGHVCPRRREALVRWA
jgi:hypothetical protein